MGKLLRVLVFPLAASALAAVYLLEKKRPLRPLLESKHLRTRRNLAVASAAAVAVYFLEKPVAERAASLVDRKRIGLLKIWKLPNRLEVVAAVVLLDYTLYLWHVLTHKLPFLWRFHVVHHIDLDLDASTAFRFHFGEIAISVAWRAVQIIVIGVSRHSLRAWQRFLLPSIIFHHSNLRLPYAAEKLLCNLIVTPRLHGIHHSTVRSETDSNWSSGLTVWDKLHRTYSDISDHDGVKIGVPAFRRPEDIELLPLIELPFTEQPPSWEPLQIDE
ncbi:sterol desaturase family protein [soil metagenome]